MKSLSKNILAAVVVSIAAAFLYFIVFILPTADSTVSNEPVQQEKKKPTEVEKADAAVYKYIVASVEADDDLRKTVLVNREHDLLTEGSHLYPDTANKMGERYTIKRFDYYKDINRIYYYIEYYHPTNQLKYAKNLLMVKEKGHWKSSSLPGIPSGQMKAAIAGHESEGILVHDYKE